MVIEPPRSTKSSNSAVQTVASSGPVNQLGEQLSRSDRDGFGFRRFSDDFKGLRARQEGGFTDRIRFGERRSDVQGLRTWFFSQKSAIHVEIGISSWYHDKRRHPGGAVPVSGSFGPIGQMAVLLVIKGG